MNNELQLENLRLKKTILELQGRLIQQEWASLEQQEKSLVEEANSNASPEEEPLE